MEQQATIKNLIIQATTAMEGDGLGETYIKNLSYTWDGLSKYLVEHNLSFSRDVAFCFLEEQYGIISGNNFAKLRPIDKRRRRAIHILINCYEDGKITKEKTFSPCVFHEAFADTFNHFIETRKAEKYALATINRDIYCLNHLSKYLFDSKVADIAEITPTEVEGFVKTLSISKNLPTLKSVSTSLRLILKYLYINRFLEKDISACVQTVRVVIHKHQ